MTDVDWTDIPAIEKAIDIPFEKWAHQCHSISYQIMCALAPEGRIARGWCDNVGSQHSWLVLGQDCYDQDTTIIDPTLWSYDDKIEGIWTGTMRDRPRHLPFGWNGGRTMFEWGCPIPGDGPNIELTPQVPLSGMAMTWINLFHRQVGDRLDRQFWSNLVNHAPMTGWDPGEIIAAVADTKEIAACVPIDILGMVTDRNPSGLYLVGPEVVEP